MAIVATDNGRIECPPGAAMQVRPMHSDEHAFIFVFCDCPAAPSPAPAPQRAVPAETSL